MAALGQDLGFTMDINPEKYCTFSEMGKIQAEKKEEEKKKEFVSYLSC